MTADADESDHLRAPGGAVEDVTFMGEGDVLDHAMPVCP